MILDYLKMYAQKAYREIHSLTTSPAFLFANDPELREREFYYNYFYIYGFNRLIKHNRIPSDKLIEAFTHTEEAIERYLRTYYQAKNFIFYLKADALIPAFTVTVVSYYEDEEAKENYSLLELVDWYTEKACFDGLKIIEDGTGEEHEEAEDEDKLPVTAKIYAKMIRT
ncbi:hypothetical protein CDO73_01525 [Saccharibacillus sp. O23]|uniref:hypothetical protein n=1 Tax=Saccharibacillus sp. O23 TaxID=2009338 RepID=UPI000B4E1FE8|nr:hypothetical protein [Saccharibacillus sp. O23]OWR32315.1 hypothetical protein CDO73_01525 [Saccharibacillus sp. O23]